MNSAGAFVVELKVGDDNYWGFYRLHVVTGEAESSKVMRFLEPGS